MIHIYCGDGKGKTTASIGLGIRALGNQIPVLFVQFMKAPVSGEIKIMEGLPGMRLFHGEKHFGFYNTMTKEQKEEAALIYTKLFQAAAKEALSLAEGQKGQEGVSVLLILDEILSACQYGFVEQKELLLFLKNKPQSLEVVLTGRNPPKELMEAADYMSCIEKKAHPFDRGIGARAGIEQ